MAIITYQCDVCNREIDVPQNKTGLEIIQRCIITSGCRGKLSQIKYLQDYLRGEYPAAVDGLNDWSQRELLYTHEQPVNSDFWLVVHNLGVFPSIQVFVTRPVTTTTEDASTVPCALRNYEAATTELVEITPENIRTVSVNEFIVEFDRPESGVVQCIARSSKPVIINQQEETVVGIQPFQLTNNAELSFATLDDGSPTVDIKIVYTSPAGVVTDHTYVGVDDLPAPGNSPWALAGETGVYVDGNKYIARSIDLTDGGIVTIEIGSSFYIEELNSNPISNNEVLLLLADDPYAVFDKILDRFIDPYGIGAVEAPTSFYFDGLNAFAYDNLIESVYPPIRIL